MLVEFCRYMTYSIRAGIPLVQGMEDFVASIKGELLRDVLTTVVRDIQAGRSLSEALEAHPRVFSPFFISVIKAGEATGQLDRAFQDLARYLEWVMNLKSRIKGAITYPIIVIVLISIALTIFSVYVIPKLIAFILELNRPIPLPTKILIKGQQIFAQYWFFIPLLILSFIIFLVLTRRVERLRYFWDAHKIRLPFVGKLLLDIVIARFLRYGEMLYRAGIQVYDLLTITKGALNNRFFEKKMDEVRNLVMEGEGLSTAIEKVQIFPVMVRRSIGVGEATGKLDEVFKELGDQYDEEIERGLRKLISLIEPALLISIALVMITIIITVLWPIYSMMGEIM